MAKERFKIIPTVYLILIKGNKILLSRRCNTGFHDGEYSFPAGHIEENETLIQAIVREVKEEISIQLNQEYLKLVHVMHRKEPKENRVNFFFTSEKWNGEPKIMEPHRCDDLRWFDINNLPNNTIPYIKQVINSFLKNVFYSEYGWRISPIPRIR
jgi:mutator protein MutT